MIVFTATEKTSGKVFAGTTRSSLEDHWGDLLSQALDGASGEFFELVRASGADAFEVEEWGYSDNPKELREMLAEAIEDLDATSIKPSKNGSKTASASKDVTLSVMKELESLKAEFDVGDDDLELEQPTASSAKPKSPTAEEVKPEQPKKEPVLRQTKSTHEAAEMNALIAGIEMRRKSARPSASKKSASTKKASAKSTAANPIEKAAKSAAEATPVAKGRTGSTAKEKRIKDAIALEKAEREAQKRAQIAAEAEEMRAIMARLDERSKQAAKVHRRM